jgi:hypothetical protein
MAPTSRYKVTFAETTFLGLLRVNGFKTVVNWTFLWCLIMTLIPVYYSLKVRHHFYGEFVQLSKSLSSVLLGASAGVLGIVIAALTITLTLFHNSLLPKMLETKLIHKFLFPFWFAVTLWGLSMVLSISLVFLDVLGFYRSQAVLFAIELFCFLYSTFYTIKLTGLVIRLALQRSQVE